jgi:type II secretory pathway component GspD/PulD (secretin)
VKSGNRPEDIPDNEEIATWIIPIRFVEAAQLMSDINPFVNSQDTTIIANQAGNSLILTGVQSATRHLVEIIRAIDSSAEDVTQVRIWKLNYADPNDVATLLMGLFSDQNNGASTPVQFGGRGGRGGGGGGRGGGAGFGGFGGFNPFAAFAGGQNANANSQQSRIRKRNQVVAVADPRTSSVAVLATTDLLVQINDMIGELDQPGKKMSVAVIPIENTNPNDVVQALQDTVGANSRNNNRNNTQNDPFTARQVQNIQNYNQNNNIFGGSSGLGGRRGGSGLGGGF